MAYPRLIVRRPIARLFRLLNPKRSQRKARVSVGSDDPSITTTSTVSRSYPSSEATAEAPIGNIYPKRLCEGEIRLLVILPSENPGDQVRCELHDHKLGDLPPYEALSYVWGDATQRSDMVCDGQSFSVTRSLGNALHRLRQPSIRRILWADAICINQEDIIERNQQVRLMGKIYSMARRVVVWLSNPPTTETNSAVTARFIQTVSDALDHLSNQVREDLKAIFSSAWFERIWCIQEIRFSHDAVVIWSNLEILWQDIGLVASWLSEFDYRNPFSHGLGHLSNAYMLYTPLAENKFLDMLDIYKFFKATDPRDKVYGLLGLLSAMPETAVLTVDYQKPLSEVYADTALAALKTSKSLDV
ncbi:HET-domain-containing protein, partial [Polyplosphaeria fusca]